MGLAFIDWDGVKVDIHRHFDAPELFDAWRLELYLESLDELDEYEESIESGLSRLVASGALVRARGDCFAFGAVE